MYTTEFTLKEAGMVTKKTMTKSLLYCTKTIGETETKCIIVDVCQIV
jgi:hypothetical protein